jgi:hypothetical protein
MQTLSSSSEEEEEEELQSNPHGGVFSHVNSPATQQGSSFL